MSYRIVLVRVPLVYLTLRKYEWIVTSRTRQIGFQLFLSRPYPRCVMFLGDTDTLVAKQNGDSFYRHASQEQLNCECVAKSMRMSVRYVLVRPFGRAQVYITELFDFIDATPGQDRYLPLFAESKAVITRTAKNDARWFGRS